MKTHAIVIALTALLLSACSPGPDKTPKIAEPQRNALDKAKGVEATVQQSAEDTKQKADEQTQ